MSFNAAAEMIGLDSARTFEGVCTDEAGQEEVLNSGDGVVEGGPTNR